MGKGKIKKLVRERGFGFIEDTDGKELFFHRSGLTGVTFESLVEDEEVDFDVEDSPKGARAVNVSIANK
jgi:CspA family cold shock protein